MPGRFHGCRTGFLEAAVALLSLNQNIRTTTNNPKPTMKNTSIKTALATVLLLVLQSIAGAATYSSLHIFGDSLSTTTNNTSAGTNYLGARFSNGHVWVEVLADRQGLDYNSNYNISYFGNNSASLLDTLTNYSAPPDVDTALYVVWVNASDLFIFSAFLGTNAEAWTTNIVNSVTNLGSAIQMLYDDGVRTLVMPNAVNISSAPVFSSFSSDERAFLRLEAIAFNNAFSDMLDTMRASLPDLTIYEPDVFSQFEGLLAHPANYGLVNPGIDALDDPALTDKSLSGPGADYIFWDQLHPTARVHALMGNLVQQVVSPARISQLNLLGAGNQLQLENIPLGENGFVESSSNLVNWTVETTITATNKSETLSVPTAAGGTRFYRLRF